MKQLRWYIYNINKNIPFSFMYIAQDPSMLPTYPEIRNFTEKEM